MRGLPTKKAPTAQLSAQLRTAVKGAKAQGAAATTTTTTRLQAANQPACPKTRPPARPPRRLPSLRACLPALLTRFRRPSASAHLTTSPFLCRHHHHPPSLRHTQTRKHASLPTLSFESAPTSQSSSRMIAAPRPHSRRSCRLLRSGA